jgi:hypothetical protein
LNPPSSDLGNFMIGDTFSTPQAYLDTSAAGGTTAA